MWDTFRDILTRVLDSTSRVRIWSAAASSGEEAYTIAMVAAEILYYFTPEEREAFVNELYRVTERGGYLFVSVTESLTGMSTPWRKVPGNTGIYRSIPLFSLRVPE